MARRTAEEAEQTKKSIGAAAKQLFIQQGYQATSMDQICQQSGVSKGSIYYHFKNKEALFIYLHEMDMEQWNEKWYETVEPAMSATDKLILLAEHYAKDFNSPLMKASEEFMLSRGSDTNIIDVMLEISRRPFPIISELLEEGMAKREFARANTEDLTLILYSMLGGLGITFMEGRPEEEICELYDKAIRIFLQGISVQ
ncbi:TetR/AcrR family transcriptional regulator [Paenibacillus profundus]|uniref:TetR/AcrR family transcriptional regulator n=1 Tax=Paenibacillus profundus TaxID=1173085 RepID=A0ABS8YCC1_9BACL|nr:MULTISPECIES: TetR/AcrR family transcriptional regulator [Paenibacillus]MCE5169668.1 TetR/AcrR family transcriptional regulator [Paenibacillus profundus]MCM3341757.1 TetR/AcrR family transcriptional regulator [Paenibacillus sp. MER TA 81-3]